MEIAEFTLLDIIRDKERLSEMNKYVGDYFKPKTIKENDMEFGSELLISPEAIGESLLGKKLVASRINFYIMDSEIFEEIVNIVFSWDKEKEMYVINNWDLGESEDNDFEIVWGKLKFIHKDKTLKVETCQRK